jgi:hypothetical protein
LNAPPLEIPGGLIYNGRAGLDKENNMARWLLIIQCRNADCSRYSKTYIRYKTAKKKDKLSKSVGAVQVVTVAQARRAKKAAAKLARRRTTAKRK